MVNQDGVTNTLLAAMVPADFSLLMNNAVKVPMTKNVDLVRAAEPIVHCWFPLSGVASVIAIDRDGREA